MLPLKKIIKDTYIAMGVLQEHKTISVLRLAS